MKSKYYVQKFDRYGTYSEQDLSHIFIPVSALPSPCTRPKVEIVAVLARKLQEAWLHTESMELCLQ